MRGKSLNQVMLLAAILAVGMLLAAHVPLHDYDLSGAHHDDYDHQTTGHDHPVITSTSAVFATILLVVAFFVPAMANTRVNAGSSLSHAFSGPSRCDDDVGLHDVLSVYRI